MLERCRKSRTLLLTGVWLVFGSHAAAAEPPDSELGATEAADRARLAFDEGRHDDALRLLELAHAREPKPVYLFNMGRVLDAAGQYGQAHAKFLLVLAQPDTDAELRQLSELHITRLEPKRHRAVVVLTLQPGAVAQVDGGLVADPATERTLDPGAHQLCVLAPGAAGAACWRRHLQAGRRVRWPPETDASTRGALTLPEGEVPRAVRVDSVSLRFPLDRLVALELDIGEHEVAVRWGDRPASVSLVIVQPGSRVPLRRSDPVTEIGVSAPGANVVADPSPAVGGWVIAGVGGGALLAGVGLIVAAAVEGGSLDDRERSRGAGGAIDAITQAEASAGRDRVATFQTTAIILAATGAAALGAGLTWALWPSSTTTGESDSDASVQVTPSPGGVLVRVLFQ